MPAPLRAFCRPLSTSRVTLNSEPSTSSSEAKVSYDQFRSAASIWPVSFESSSIASLPRTCGLTDHQSGFPSAAITGVSG